MLTNRWHISTSVKQISIPIIIYVYILNNIHLLKKKKKYLLFFKKMKTITKSETIIWIFYYSLKKKKKSYLILHQGFSFITIIAKQTLSVISSEARNFTQKALLCCFTKKWPK